jgi:hypothetical protein
MAEDNLPAFDAMDAQAVHHAMKEAESTAVARQETMPSSANAFRRHAEALKRVRDKILGRLSESVRRDYP